MILLTARHVIEGAFEKSAAALYRSTTMDLSHLPGPDNTLYKNIGQWISSTDDLKCHFVIGAELVACGVTGICLRPPIDIAYVIVERRSLGIAEMPVFAINSDPLRLGQEVVLMSFATSTGGTKQVRDLNAKFGKITRIRADGRLAQAPVYETNIPIEEGASGGPVFKYMGDFNGEKQVVGVVSTDFSDEKSFKDEEIDGQSYIAMIASDAPLQVHDPTDGDLSFKDLCKRGMIADRGSAMNMLELNYFPDGNWHQGIPS